MQAEVGVGVHKPGGPGLGEATGGKITPRPRESGLWPLDRERTRFCGFEGLGLWPFALAALPPCLRADWTVVMVWMTEGSTRPKAAPPARAPGLASLPEPAA